MVDVSEYDRADKADEERALRWARLVHLRFWKGFNIRPADFDTRPPGQDNDLNDGG